MNGVSIAIFLVFQIFVALSTSYKLKHWHPNDKIDLCIEKRTEASLCQNNGTCMVHGNKVTCDCGTAGYFGDRCEKRDPCFFENDCQNNGICSRLTDELHACYCLEGSHGLTCEYTDACVQNPCRAGTCERLMNHYKCHCFEGYEGSECETRDPCIIENRCLNSGECVRISNDESNCVCKLEFAGDYCEYSNACYFKSPCQNGGSCKADRDGFICECTPGYLGSRCEGITAGYHDPCILQNIPCLNDGKCERLNNRVGKCICTENYVGENCAVRRPCAVNPCRNQGACRVSADGYGSSCKCQYGFSGEICQIRDPCKLDGIACHNGGTCGRVSNGKGKCTCLAPYYGPTCELKEYCSFGTCKHGGTCINLQEERDFKCLCPKGYSGKRCEFKAFCSTIFAGKCLHNSTCIDQQDEVTIKCYCQKGYTGTYCEHRNPCELDGIECVHGFCERIRDDLAHCVCNAHYHGPKCEFSQACLSSPCENNGKCENAGNVYLCKCPVGFRGQNCEIKCPECLEQYEYYNARAVLVKKTRLSSLPLLPEQWAENTLTLRLRGTEDFCQTKFRHSCRNGGQCVNATVTSFQCICPEIWSGNDCSIRDYTCSRLNCIHGLKTLSTDGSSCFCNCTKPFTGSLCSEKDACSGEDRCGPGGICLPLPNQDYVCHCKPGYSGPECSIRDPCQLEGSTSCLNGGTCFRIRDFKYACKCPVPFMLPDCKEENWCTIPPGECTSSDDPNPRRCFPCRPSQKCAKSDSSSYTCTSFKQPATPQIRRIIRLKNRVRTPHFYYHSNPNPQQTLIATAPPSTFTTGAALESTIAGVKAENPQTETEKQATV